MAAMTVDGGHDGKKGGAGVKLPWLRRGDTEK
jgi:hypothetical protein